jgi:hypothetical protein
MNPTMNSTRNKLISSNYKYLIVSCKTEHLITNLVVAKLNHIAIEQLLTLGTGLGITAETQIDAGKNTCKTDDKTQTKNQFMSSQIFHYTPCRRVRETTD